MSERNISTWDRSRQARLHRAMFRACIEARPHLVTRHIGLSVIASVCRVVFRMHVKLAGGEAPEFPLRPITDQVESRATSAIEARVVPHYKARAMPRLNRVKRFGVATDGAAANVDSARREQRVRGAEARRIRPLRTDRRRSD